MGIDTTTDQNNKPDDLRRAMRIVTQKWNEMNLTKNKLKDDEPNCNKEIKFHDYMEAHIIVLISGIS